MQKYYLNRNWKYCDSFEGVYLIEPMENGESVEIPHTFKETPFNYVNFSQSQIQCIYQREFEAKPEWKGKRITLTFEGVAQRATIYINGVNVVVHECGTTPFDVDIEAKIYYDKPNLITVLVDSRNVLSQPPFVGDKPVDTIAFGGIYRDVYLTVREMISMKRVLYNAQATLPPDTRGMNRASLSEYKVPGRLNTKIEFTEVAHNLALDHKLFVRQYLNDEEIAYQPLGEDGLTNTTVGSVQIWDLDSPVCYRIQTDLIYDDVVVDTDVSLVGFRTAVFDRSGFYLNGRRVKIRGVVRNQIFPYVGYAMPESIQRMDARILKEELHVNAVRCCGEFPSPYFLDECDKRGILVFCEVPGYRNIGNENFVKVHLKNIEEMICHGYNHPSIFLWGVRINGSPSSELDRLSVDAAHRIDPYRATAGERIDKDESIAEDVYAYTDFSCNGKGTPLLSKEEVSSDMQKPYLVSGYMGESLPVRPQDGYNRKLKQITYAASVLDAQAFLDDLCGSFALSMCDHLTMAEHAAEDGMAYHGLMDAFRNKKPAATVYSTQNNPNPEIMVYPPISGDDQRWDGYGDIYILTNTESVRVYRDKEFVAEYSKADSPFGKMRHGPILLDDLIGDESSDEKTEQARRLKKMLNQMAIGGIASFTQPGQMMDRIMSKLVYRMNRKQLMRLYEDYVSREREFRFDGIVNGEVVASTTLKRGRERYLRTDASSNNLIERHGYDVIQVRLMITNELGEPLVDYAEPIIATATGPIKILGPAVIPLRGGMAGIYIRSVGEEGVGELTLYCGDIPSSTLKFSVLRAPEEAI